MPKIAKKQTQIEKVVIRFAGDSGDGMQLTGKQFTNTTALFGNDLSTLPDFPAEIRAPAGTPYGVSAFQIHFGSAQINTPGDHPDVLVAMNPAALIANLKDLRLNAIIIANEDAFSERYLKLAGFDSNPLKDGKLSGYQLFTVPITTLTRNALEDLDLSINVVDRCKNFFALGMMYWMYSRPLEMTKKWIELKFKSSLELIEANTKALTAGYNFALTTEVFTSSYEVPTAEIEPGLYRNINGNDALCMGIVAAGEKSGLSVFMAGYPITPASEVLHTMSKYKSFGVKTFQAEDEMSGICAALGASYSGSIGFTATSGPGLALKSETIGLAIMTELPLVICDIQRGGPSTGLPTKTEQADLFLALYGRHAEAPLPVVAAKTPADCFHAMYEAVQIALRFMTPVILLSDAYLANGSEPWKIVDPDSLDPIEVNFASDPDTFAPYYRFPETLSRMWALPGTRGLEHRIGGLEKEDITGHVSYDPDNHERMVRLRHEKVKRVADFIPEPQIEGSAKGDLLVISWGSTYGTVHSVVNKLREEGKQIGHYHLRWINPLPKNLGDAIKEFKKVLIPEINLGQLIHIIRDTYLVDAKGYNSIKGLPLRINELKEEIETLLKEV
jgi:2-oxoglutarate ferredoxin oxidoreductase subunit alpha